MLALALLAGCGGGGEREQASQLPRLLAADLAARSESVASRLDAGDPCAARSEAQRLQADAIDAVNTRRVPGPLQEELLASVAQLVEAIECVPAPPAGEAEGDDDDDEGEAEEPDDGDGKPGRGKGGKKGKGKGKS